jgi:hypothetical protein
VNEIATTPRYEVYAIRYATREGRRRDNFIGGDPHDGPMPMDYFVWVVVGYAETLARSVRIVASSSIAVSPLRYRLAASERIYVIRWKR